MSDQTIDMLVAVQQGYVPVEKLATVERELNAVRAELLAERERNAPLRARIKAIQDEADKRIAPIQKDLAYLRSLMAAATHHYRNNQPELHRLCVEELVAKCSAEFRESIERYPLSAWDQATIAVMLGALKQVESERDSLRAQLAVSEARAQAVTTSLEAAIEGLHFHGHRTSNSLTADYRDCVSETCKRAVALITAIRFLALLADAEQREGQ